ncbi:DUF4097 domain-containing protein [Clostridium sp. Cult3]|uniref:DUF4097 domain-containing protein n=1 Tax=Clostridium sp. Cult3 TaxID=2079004 RepID=UPI001F2F3454|nr:DUF4097 domain-containing protein [Clostridium sp. Cult3]MCF6460908.1 hypothetical protein [Clostridium sp. Cult3]
MTTKKLVLILVGVALVAFGVGLLSLNRYGFNIYDRQGINIAFDGIDIRDGNSAVNIGPGGIHIVDGDEQVKVGFKGIWGKNTKNLIKKDIDEEKLEDIKGIKNIDIETPFIDINIIPEKREDVKIHYNGYVESSYIPKLETNKSNNTLYIVAKKGNSNSYSVYNSNLKLDIYVPMDFKYNIRTITSSGDIKISKLELMDLDLTASSGDIQVYDMNLDNLSIETSSGEQELKNIKSQNSSFLASSGDIEIYNFTGDINITTSSGDIHLDYKTFNNNVGITASSGDVKVILPSNSNFNLDANTFSGEIESNFPVTITGKLKNNLSGKVGNGTNSINITTSSGDISINSK